MNPLLAIFSAFGLAGAAGLRAYVPLFAVGLLSRLGVMHLSPPFDMLGYTWVLVLLAVLCVLEFFADKIPVVDHALHVLQTVVGPAAGAVLFAAQAGGIVKVHPAVWLILGLLSALTVHSVRAAARPVVNVTTAGFGGPVISFLEDALALLLTILSIVVPVLAVLLLVGILALFLIFARKFTRRLRRPAAPVELAK